MTRTQMMAILDTYLIDPDRTAHSETERGYALDNSQSKVCLMINNKYLSVLKVKDSNKTVSSGIFDLTNLSLSLLGDNEENIIYIKVYNGNFSNKVDMEDIVSIENGYFTPTLNDPRHYFEDYKIKILPTSITKIDICFLRNPTSIISSGDCGLSSVLHHLIVKLSASELLKAEGNSEKAFIFEKLALDDINMLNAKYESKENKK